MLQISTSNMEDAVVVHCTGEIVYREEAAALRQQVKALLEKNRCVVLDLAGISRVDSNGLGTLVGLLGSAKSLGHDLVFAALGTRMRDVLKLTRLTALFDIHETVEKAVESHRLAATPISISELAS